MSAVAQAYGQSFGSGVIAVGEAWGDGRFTAGDIVAPVGLGMEALGLFLDPVNWVVGKLLEPIYNWIFENVKPLKVIIETITGSPEQVTAQADQYRQVSQSMADQANALVESANQALNEWEGQARDAFRAVVESAVSKQTSIASSINTLAEVAYGLAAIVSAVKEIVLGLIKELITELVTKGVMVALAAIPSLGSAIAAYMAWASAKYALVLGKVSASLAKLFSKASKLVGESSKLGKLFTKISGMLEQLAERANQAARINRERATQGDAHRQGAQNQRNAADRSYTEADNSTGMDQVHAQHRGNQQRDYARGEDNAAIRDYDAGREETGNYHVPDNAGRGRDAVSEADKAEREHHEQRSNRGNPADQVGDLVD